MTSLLTSVKTTSSDTDYYISVASLIGKVYSLNPTSLVFSTSNWASANLVGGPGLPVSTVSAAGAVLKDMGTTVVSSLRTFRKIQLMLAGTNSTFSTFGVGGRVVSVGDDYLTGYIELGFDGNGSPAPVAQFGR
jgi:hypothetical protein